jgi:hypothetical protein
MGDIWNDLLDDLAETVDQGVVVNSILLVHFLMTYVVR